MAANALMKKLCRCSMIDCTDTGAIAFITAKNKFEKPVISDLIRLKTPDQEAQASEIINTHKKPDSQVTQARGGVQTTAQLRRSEVIENYLRWLCNKEVKHWNERAIWALSGLNSDMTIEDIAWGLTSPVGNQPTHNSTLANVFRDDLGLQAFEQALRRLQGHNTSSGLPHTELDVQGIDAHCNHHRVQRTLEIKLKIAHQPSEQGPIEKTTMELKRTVKISTPAEALHPLTKPNAKEVYQDILEQLAQHEVNKAFDERNHYLRAVFRQDVDHVRIARQSTIAAHDWSFQKPRVGIRGPDGTILLLRETRTDSANDGKVVLTYTVAIEQVRGVNGKDHLFDLPVEGCESERQIQQARWTISSAIDKCI
ncbi:hypothetical protein N431DRAFT_442218 [Stipitochalara longipes BDJ]|nr:hypothetical protein N431DRAFT_442218 [Stipitochalara longipes BDJ]